MHIFASWFESEFVPFLRCHVCSRKLEEKDLLVSDHSPAYPYADVRKLKDRKIRAVFLPKNTTAPIHPVVQGIIKAFKACYCGEACSGVVNSKLQITEFLKTLMLEDVAYIVQLGAENYASYC
jgi:hypothetical protein